MIQLSELEMANSFEKALKSSVIRCIPHFDIVYRELKCQQGIPDFIGIPSDKFVTTFNFSTLSSIESSSVILSFLKYHSGRRKDYLKKKTALSDNLLNKSIRELQNNKFIVEANGLYYISPQMELFNDNIWAFELKLSNWKRALFQALQNKTFSNFSIVVFPFGKEHVLMQNLDVFAKLNVGVLLFEASSFKTKWLYRAKKEQPVSKWATWFLLGKVSSQKSQEISLLSFHE